MNQKEYIGRYTVNNLKEILSKHNPKTIFLVTDKSSYEQCGAKSIFINILKNYNTIHFHDFEINPKFHDIEKGIKIFKENNCDFVIAVGGGSVIDVAKSVNILTANNENPESYIKNTKMIENKGKPIVAIPTTSGGGGEVTHFAVVYLNNMKYSLAHNYILPDYAIVDPQFLTSLPPYVTAYTGMDAIANAIESYWCIYSNDESKDYARKAIKLAMTNLPIAVNNPTEKSREAMAKAAYLSGKAVNITKSTACHAISYPISSYFGVPHGHAVALTLAQMLIYNSKISEEDLLDNRGVIYVRNIINELVDLIDTKDVEDASKKITKLMQDIGLNTRLSDLGIKTNEDIGIIIKNGFNPDRVKNNPRLLTEEALIEILECIR